MKKIIAFISVFSIINLVGANLQACDAMKYKQQCVSQLAAGYTFIKSYLLDDTKLNAATGEIEYSFVFSKGTVYMLTMSDNQGNPKNIEIKLYDPNHKLIVSNLDAKSGSYFPISYPCSATGIHYMTFKINDATKCGLSVLGFKRGE